MIIKIEYQFNSMIDLLLIFKASLLNTLFLMYWTKRSLYLSGSIHDKSFLLTPSKVDLNTVSNLFLKTYGCK